MLLLTFQNFYGGAGRGPRSLHAAPIGTRQTRLGSEFWTREICS